MVKRRKSKYVALVIFALCLVSCSHYPETPKGVVEAFLNDFYSGDCESALQYCEEDARTVVETSLENGCKPNENRIDSIICAPRNEYMRCMCYETWRDDDGRLMNQTFRFPYNLKRIDGKWKVVNTQKDQPEWTTDELIKSDLELR